MAGEQEPLHPPLWTMLLLLVQPKLPHSRGQHKTHSAASLSIPKDVLLVISSKSTSTFLFFFFFFFFCLFRAIHTYTQHMEVPRLRVISEL